MTGMNLRALLWAFAVTSVACTARLTVGEEIFEHGEGAGAASDAAVPSTVAGPSIDDGGGASTDAQAGDGDPGLASSTSPQIEPCPGGRLCWSAPLPTGDDFVSVWAAADDDVWLATLSGTIVHYDGASFEVRYQAVATTNGQVTSVKLWGKGQDVYAFVNHGDATTGDTQPLHWSKGVLQDVTSDPSLYGFTSKWGQLLLQRPMVSTLPLTPGKVDGPFASGVGLTTSGNLYIGGGETGYSQGLTPTLAFGDSFVDIFAGTDAAGTQVWALTDQGHLFTMTRAPSVNSFAPATQLPDFASSTYGVGLWGTSRSDVWSISEEEASMEPDASTTVIRHFDGTSWTTTQTFPGCRDHGGQYKQLIVNPPSLTGPQRIWGRSSKDIWAVNGGAHCVGTGLLHWDGSTWSQVTTTDHDDPLPSSAPYLGGTDTSVFVASTHGRLFQKKTLDATWSQLAGMNPTQTIFSLSNRSHDDVWAVRGPAQTVVSGDVAFGTTDILHFDGSAWHTVPAIPDAGSDAPTAILGFGPSDAWVSTGKGFKHWDGVAWSTVESGGGPAGFWGGSSRDLWATVSGAPGSSWLAHWDGASWSKTATFCFAGPIAGALGHDDFWFVAAQATDAGACSNVQLYHHTAAGNVAVPCAVALAGDAGLVIAGDEVWSSTGQHIWGGTSCRSEATIATTRAGWASSATDVWFVGASANDATRARVIHWDGSTFTEDQSAPLGPNLAAIDGAGPGDFWVGGAGGALLRTALDVPRSPLPPPR